MMQHAKLSYLSATMPKATHPVVGRGVVRHAVTEATRRVACMNYYAEYCLSPTHGEQKSCLNCFCTRRMLQKTKQCVSTRSIYACIYDLIT